ncbi:MAG: bifunctional 5,10-methylenetetrahydrofolate dehydrogenase/5,10-methenyltetrahydrofolate cyclohydrolase [bacterium]|nr:bifunctional 5,10-methylenetetrahydrofolate dehydrogenase/5,10-methenyltetrahydrofolate cyclohydrolase [bacterium]
MIIVDGRKIAKEILENLKQEVAGLSFAPVFCDVLVGGDSASVQYVKMKAKKAEELGIRFHNANFPSSTTTEELVQEIHKLNKIENMCGIIVQLPLPEQIDQRAVLDAIDPKLDVDALGSETNKKFYAEESSLGLPTALACIHILESLKLDLTDKKIVVLGFGELVGKPVFALLNQKGLNPTALRSKTYHKEEILKNADIIISGIGKGAYIKSDMIKKGAVIIDAGTSESGAGLVGDVDIESVQDIASYVSPVPGGVGPVTIAMLFRNVLEVAKTSPQPSPERRGGSFPFQGKARDEVN